MSAAPADRRHVVRGTALVAALTLASQALLLPRSSNAAEGRVLQVPSSAYATIEAAIAASEPGDLILLGAGTYPGGVVVPQDKGGITIRGGDRNLVVFDGQDQVPNAIEVEADGVTLENMTAHNFVENGFYWDGVKGFAGRYLTVWNVGLYGIYALESSDGIVEESLVSGAADAAFYIGECYPCNTTLRHNTATLSAVGYSGTNAGGNLLIETSIFDSNAIGILPNSYDVGLATPPERESTFQFNVVRGSGSVPTPRRTPLGGFYGIGIGIAGGVDNIVDGNDVTGSSRYGIAVFATVDPATRWVPSGNRITDNHVAGSGKVDLALAAGAGDGNCFEGNDAGTMLPAGIAGACSAVGGGDAGVAAELVLPPPQLLEGLPEPPPYTAMLPPPPEPTMPAELPAAADFGSALATTIVAIVAIVAGVAMVYAARPRNILDPKDRGNIGLRTAGITLVVIGASGVLISGLLLLEAGRASPGPSGARPVEIAGSTHRVVELAPDPIPVPRERGPTDHSWG